MDRPDHLWIDQMDKLQHVSTPPSAACQHFSITACALYLHIRFMYSSQSSGPTKRLIMPPRAMKSPKGKALRRCTFPAAISSPPETAPSKAPRNTARAA